jgi:inhibitor of cysteine peptidase
MNKNTLMVLGAVALIVIGAVLLWTDDGTTRVTNDDNGAAVTLGDDETLVLDLDGNITTGYTWEIEAVDDSILRLVGGDFEYRSDSDLEGSPGTFTFTFEPVATGETDLRLIYHRPWEEDVDPLEIYELTITVG